MSDQRKIGEGHAQAWFRAGAKELGQALTAFPAHSIQPVEEPGLFGNATQMDVNLEKGNTTPYQQWLEEKSQHVPEAAQKQPERGLER